MRNFSFPNKFKLKSKKIMDELFQTAHSKLYYPILSKFKFVNDPSVDVPIQFAFSVPKRRIRKAVHRNLIKRRMVESTRLHKHIIYEHNINATSPLIIMFIYTANELLDYDQIESSIVKQLQHICDFLPKTSSIQDFSNL